MKILLFITALCRTSQSILKIFSKIWHSSLLKCRFCVFLALGCTEVSGSLKSTKKQINIIPARLWVINSYFNQRINPLWAIRKYKMEATLQGWQKALPKRPQKWPKTSYSTMIHKIFQAKFSCEIVRYGKTSISVFQEILFSTVKVFISRGGISTRQ